MGYSKDPFSHFVAHNDYSLINSPYFNCSLYLSEQIKKRQHDAEETVRIEVVNTLLNIAKKNFDAMTDELLEIVKERTRDKKV